MSLVTSLLSISVGAILVENFIFSQFLGICPFMGVSKKMDTALGMGCLLYTSGQCWGHALHFGW